MRRVELGEGRDIGIKYRHAEHCRSRRSRQGEGHGRPDRRWALGCAGGHGSLRAT